MNLIGQVGTFDVENYGDLLYPIVFRHLLSKYRPDAQVRLYSFLEGPAPYDTKFETHSIRSLFQEVTTSGDAGLDALVIGGGDILRTDWTVMASHYNRWSGEDTDLSVKGQIGRFLRQKISGASDGVRRAKRFQAQWMNYPGAGPFLFSLPAPVAYMSCGVPQEFEPHEIDAVAKVLSQAQFVYVRDEQSADKLRRAGVNRDVHVSPDVAVLISDVFDKEEHRFAARRRLGIQSDEHVLCFQSQPYPTFDLDSINDRLVSYAANHHATVVLLPLGYCHGDNEFLHELSKRSPASLKYVAARSLTDMMSTIAASDIFVGTSLHGCITALSFGIPHVLGPLPVDKADGYIQVTNLPASLKLKSWGDLGSALEAVAALDENFFSSRAQEAKARVLKVVNQLFKRILK